MKNRHLITLALAGFCASTALSADVRDGLVAYWPLNSGTGSYPMLTPDVVAGNDLVGIYNDSGSSFVPGRFGNAIAFEGNYSYLTFQAPPDSDTGLPVSKKGSWTISAWVKGDPQPGGNYYLVESSSFNANPLTAFTARANTNTTAIYVRDANGNNPVNLPAVTNVSINGDWHHVAMTYDAATRAFRHYVDGSLVYTNSFAPDYNNNQRYDLVNLGGRNRNGTQDLFFAGAVDEVAMWGRALSEAELQEVKTTGIATPVPAFKPSITMDPSGAANLLPGDTFKLSAFSCGTRPLTYQWLKNGTSYPGATTDSLNLVNLTTADSGAYRLVVSNALGSVTSAVAQITVNDYGVPNLTNGMVAYWPLDGLAGVRTPDLVSAYDLTVANMGSTNLVPGKWGNALSFEGAKSQFARRIHNPGDSLPIYSRSNFTVAFWAKAPLGSTGWAFAESSTVNNFPAFCMGIFSSTSDKLDGFVRDNSGNPSGDHRLSARTFWDDTWHHVAWVQHDAGGSPKASLYIDGVLDTANNLNPRYPVTPNNTALGAFARATPAQFFTGAIDDVIIWERPLSPAELLLLQTGPITNPPSRLSPLAVNSFKSDLPAVARGDATFLRWDVPANATQVLLEPLGDVTSRTLSGLGSTNVTLTNTTVFVLTVKRGLETIKATNTIAVVQGVAPNWTLLDNFDSYPAGALGANGWWVDVAGNSVSVVTSNGNRMVRTTQAASAAYLRLNSLTVTSNQAATLFFRLIPRGNPAGTLRHNVGLTDKAAQFYYQLDNNIGPVIQPTVNDPAQTPGDWLLAARNLPYSVRTFATNVLQVGAVYNVWIDVTNVFIGDRGYADMDQYSVYIQREGDPGRTLVFDTFTSDRDLGISDPLAGGFPTDEMNRIFLGGNSDTDSAWFDDFYLSKSGYNATIPRAFGYSGGALPALQITHSGSQLLIQWAEGILQQSDQATGPWTDVNGAAAPAYQVTPSGTAKFYRARY